MRSVSALTTLMSSGGTPVSSLTIVASIAIRTAVVRRDRMYFSAGGGVVADSEPEQEYRETLDKARGIIDVLATR